MKKRKYVIAVVDDDPRFLEALGSLLESAGYVVQAFSSGKVLIDAGLSGIDCVLTDLSMPALDGFALHDLVKDVRPELPVFLITGRNEIGDQQRASAKGINGFFRKPIDGPTLLTAVGDVCALNNGGENEAGR